MELSDERAREIGARLAELASKAYAPYSRFHVAALALAEDGEEYAGVNLENASYGLTLCAEAGALSAAAAGGGFSRIAAVAVMGGYRDGSGLGGSDPVFPCGRCRQLIFETASLQGRDIDLLCFSGDRSRVERTSIRRLLPNAFGPGALA